MIEIFSLPNQNTVGVCNQITILILYYKSFRLVTLVEITDTPIRVSDIFYLTVTSSSSILAVRFISFFLKYLLASRLTLFGLSTLLWFNLVTAAF